jgi:hypothetical protein
MAVMKSRQIRDSFQMKEIRKTSRYIYNPGMYTFIIKKVILRKSLCDWYAGLLCSILSTFQKV